MDTQPLTSPSPESPKRALLIEPNSGTQKLCCHVLERAGFAVDTVVSGIQAVVSARSHQPDLILMDLQLPDVPCRQAIDWLRSNPALRFTPILVLNGASGEGDNFADASPVSVIPKPLSAQSVQRAIQQAPGFAECSGPG